MRRAVFGLGLRAGRDHDDRRDARAASLSATAGRRDSRSGGALAMSSTAIVSKMLAERMELATPHGRDVMGILLFQDLAVVAFLIVLPSLSKSGGDLAIALALAGVKAVGRAGADPVRRPGADARVVPPRRAAAQLRAVHAERAAGHAGTRGADRARRALARAGRIPRRHADRRDRVPLPGRGGHQAVPRRAARAVLRHRRHGARSRRRRAQPAVGARCCSSCRCSRSSC